MQSQKERPRFILITANEEYTANIDVCLDRYQFSMDNQKYQTGFKRLGAAIVDGIVFMPLLLIEKWLVGKTDNNSIIISWSIFTTFLTLFYSIFAHYKYGQTIG